MHGALSTPPLPQGRPVLVQAGQSGDGRDFAAKTAEAIFCLLAMRDSIVPRHFFAPQWQANSRFRRAV